MTRARIIAVVRRIAGLAVVLVTATPVASSASAGPSAPVLRLLSAHPTVVLGWSAPTGSVVGYVVMESRNDTQFAQVTPVLAATTFSPAHLRSGTTYEFVVIAEMRGATASAPSNLLVVTVVSAPSAPREAHARAQAQSALVTWLAPSNDGGRPITRYDVTSSPGSAHCRERVSVANLGAQIPGPPQRCVVRGLRDGVAYRFRVTAANTQGIGSPSAWSRMVRPGEPPTSPRGVSARPLDAAALITWSAPPRGSRAVTFRVTSMPGGASCTSSGTSCQVRGLTNGVIYTFRVSARNAIGTSKLSASSLGVRPGVLSRVSVGPLSSPGIPLSVDQDAQVQRLATQVQFGGATFVALIGHDSTLAIAQDLARLVAAQLRSDLSVLGVTDVSIEVAGQRGSGPRSVLAVIS